MNNILKTFVVVASTIGSFFLAISDSHALPVFARQMGLGCETCHAATYPLLTPFGRAFKASGYTLTGAQEKVEGDKLSIPSVLNLGVLASARWDKTNGKDPAPSGAPFDPSTNVASENNGQVSIPDEVTLFFGGRAGEHIGFLGEAHFTDTPDSHSGILGGGKMPIGFDVGPGRLMVVPFTTSGNGVSYSFELLNTGANAVHTIMEDNASVYSAAQYLGTATDATGIALVGVSNDLGFINFAKWSPNHLIGGSGSNGYSANPTSNYFRFALTPSSLIPNWDTDIGVQVWNGSSVIQATDTTPSPTNLGWEVGGVTTIDAQIANGLPMLPYNLSVETKAWVVDGQLQGAIGGNFLGVWASYGVAAASDCSSPAGVANLFNPGCSDMKSFNIGALYEVVPHLLFLDAGYRNATRSDPGTSTWYNTQLAGMPPVAYSTFKDNGVTLGAILKFTQNTKVEFTYGKFTGSYYTPTGGPFSVTDGLGNLYSSPLGYPNASAMNGGGSGSSVFIMELSADF